MNRVQALILPAAILGSLIVVAVGIWATGNNHFVEGLFEAIRFETTPSAEAEDLEATEAALEKPKNIPCELSEGYPDEIIQWCGLITSSAQDNGLDPDLVAAVMLRESNGNPDAYSKSGAVGLLQVMPSDGLAADFECVNGPCFAGRPSIKELEDPEYNLTYGVQLLADLIEETGDLREALKAYGPYNVEYQYADFILQTYNSYR